MNFHCIATPRMLCRPLKGRERLKIYIYIYRCQESSQWPPPAHSIPRVHFSENPSNHRLGSNPPDTGRERCHKGRASPTLTNDSALFWHQLVPKRKENKCKCINTKHTAIRRLYSIYINIYIFIFRCRQANCKDVEVFLCFHGIFLGFVHAMHYLLVLQVHIAVEVNFYTFCALCKKVTACPFHTFALQLFFSEKLYLNLLTQRKPDLVLWKTSTLLFLISCSFNDDNEGMPYMN